MKAIKHVLISGLGAVGSVYATMLSQLDPEMVSVVADPIRLVRYQEKGIYVNGTKIPFQLETHDGPEQPFDLILVAVKQHHLEEAIVQMKRFVGANTLILSLLNGIISEEMLADAYGKDRVINGFCVGTDATRIDTHTRFSNTGKIIFGIPGVDATDARIQVIRDLFEQAHIPHVVPKDILREQWWKFMMNVGINQISAILRAPYGVFQEQEAARNLMRSACQEVVTLAKAEGVSLTLEDIESYFPIINGLQPQAKTSMHQDIEAGRKTELVLFSGTVMALGKKHGIPTPINELLNGMIRVLEAM